MRKTPSYISFLFSQGIELVYCLFLTLMNLISPTFSMKPWHFLNMEVDKIDASFDLHNSVCVALLSRRLFIDLILACRRCLSAD